MNDTDYTIIIKTLISYSKSTQAGTISDSKMRDLYKRLDDISRLANTMMEYIEMSESI